VPTYDRQSARGNTAEIAPLPGDAAMPQDVAAERSVLSAMMLSEDVLQECLIALQPDDFYLHANRQIFMSMREMFDHNEPVDPISLSDHLKSAGELERIGGASYLVELGSNSLALASWRHHTSMLKRDATLRELISASARIQAMAFDAPQDSREVVDYAEKQIFDVTGRDVHDNAERLADIMSELYDQLDEMSKSSEDVFGVKTGFRGIDEALQGLRSGQMVVVGARPGVGKTSFALNLCINMAKEGASVVFFSLEMSKIEIAQRLLSATAGVPLSDIRGARIQDSQWVTLIEATSQLSDYDVMIDDTAGTTITEIRAKARRLLRDKKNGVVILDYLQLVSPPAGRYRADSRATEVSEMSRGLKVMAKDLEVPVIALSQLNRTVEGRTGKRPQLSDLRESGAIEQDADIVILLDRSSTQEEGEREDRPDWGITQFNIAKNRSGPLATVDLTFLANSTKFVEVYRPPGGDS
jgi:replicative DNA helicase